jgi:hypothetical protein
MTIAALPDYPELKEAVTARVAEIARSDPDWAKRRFCIEDMTLSAALPSALRREMASSDPHPEVRAAAAKFLAQASAPLGDPAAMAERARNSPDPEARRMALPWVQDRPRWRRSRRSDPDPEVRSAAVDRLVGLSTPETQAETEAVLLRIAEKDKDNGVRLSAASGLKDERALARLAQKSPLPEVRAHAGDDQRPGGDRLRLSTTPTTRRAVTAIRRVTDQAVLRRIATSKAPALRGLSEESRRCGRRRCPG